MAKLTKKQQKSVQEAESGFTPVPEGIYPAKVLEVDTNKEGPAGPYWKFTFGITKGKHKGRKQWMNASLSEEAAWRMQEVFDAVGLELDADSEEFVGENVRLQISEGTIGAGPRKGEPSNNVDKVLPFESDNGGEPEDGEPEAEDLEALAALADDEEADEDDAAAAVERLTELAEEQSLDPDEYGTWADLVAALEPEEEEEKPKRKAKAGKKAADEDFEF